MSQKPNHEMFAAPEFEVARDVLGDEINKTREKLLSLQQAYEALGGTYEDEDQALLDTARRGQRQQAMDDGEDAAGEADYSVLVNGVTVRVSGREREVILKLQKNEGGCTKIDDLASLYGGVKQRWYNGVAKLNGKLHSTGFVIVNVRSLGYVLEKAS